MDYWFYLKEFLFPLFVSGGTAFAILKFLPKKIIEQQLQKDIENHKQELSEKTETLKHSLSIYAHEKNIKATRVDSQLSNAIKSVYSEFVKLFNSAEIFANQPPPRVCPYDEMDNKDSQNACTYKFYKEHAEEIEKHSEQLKQQLDINAIYIDLETYNIIFDIQKNFNKLSKEFLEPIREEVETRGDIEEIVGDLFDLKNKLTDYYNTELSGFQLVIVNTFRKQLGII